jgi:PAS domain S-box-containing protein
MTVTTPLAGANPETESALAVMTESAADPGQPYRELFEHMREGFAYCHAIFEGGDGCDFVYLAVNGAFERLTGLKDVIGRRVSDVIPGIRESDPELLRTYARVARSGVSERFEMFVHALGMWFSISVYSPNREFFVAVFDVITERKEAEKALRESEEAMRELFDDAPLPYHEIDRNGIVRRVNRTECNLLGVTAADMVGRPIWDFVVPQEREASRAAFARKMQGPDAPIPSERTFRASGGAEVVFQVHDRFIRDSAGRIAGLRSAMVDVTETKRLNVRLGTERQLLRALMDQSPDHIYFKDAQGRFILVNATMALFLGCGDPSQVAGKTDFDFFSPEHAEPAFQDEQDLIAERIPVVSKEEKESWPDGRETWASTTKLSLRDPSGKITGTFGISRDITERRRIEAALRASEERLRLAQETLNLGTWELDLATGRAQCSQQLLRLYGRPGTEMDRSDWLSAIDPDDRQWVRTGLDESLRTGEPLTRRFRVVWPDGSVHWLHSMSRVIRDAENRPVRVVGIDFDVTGQAEAEERLRILSTALEQSPVSIVITDLDGRIEYVNPKVTEVTGYTAGELIGGNPNIFKSGETKAEEYRELWRTIRTGEWRGTFHNRKKNGELFWEAAVIRPILGPSGAPTHYIAVKEDITARKAAEDKMAWLASFPEQNPNPVVEIEVPEGVVQYVNPVGRDLFLDLHQKGLAHAWLAGLDRVAEALAAPDRQEVRRDVMVGDFCYSQTVHYLPEVRRLRVYGADITERKHTEVELRRSETKFRAIWDFTSDAMMLLNERGFFDCNHAALTMFGCTREEFCSRHPAGMSPAWQPGGADSETLADQHIAAAMAKGSDHFEWVHQRLDTGETFPAEVLLNVMELDGERVLQAVVRDITERKRADNALRESELKYRTLVQHIPQMVFYKDRDSVYVSCNESFAQDLGIPAADVPGKTDFDFHPPDLAEKYRADDRRIMELGRTEEIEEERITKGRTCTVLTVKTPVVDEHGEVTGVLGVFTDITERKRAEEALRQTERQLRLAQKLESIGSLAAGIAHEINTPVQYIGDNAQFLSSAFQDLFRVIEGSRSADGASSESGGGDVDVEYLRGEIPNAIAQMQEGVERVGGIVRAMKRFSHPGPAEKTAIDIHQAIESTILVSRNEWKYVAEVATDFDPAMPLVPCVAGEFNQVILNLIVNAAHAIAEVVKGSGGKGAIRVGTRRNGEWAEIRVSDTGGGIPEAIRGKVFDPFFTTKEVGKGTGQGLAIAHSVIVQRHRGTIGFESETGKGTTFLVRLPLPEGGGM